MTEFGLLLEDEHFVFKFINSIALIYGLKHLFRTGNLPTVMENIFVVLGLAGGFIANVLLMYLYKLENKNDNLENAILIIYGALNLCAAYACGKRFIRSMYCCYPLYSSPTFLFISPLFVSTSMLGEYIYYQRQQKEEQED